MNFFNMENEDNNINGKIGCNNNGKFTLLDFLIVGLLVLGVIYAYASYNGIYSF